VVTHPLGNRGGSARRAKDNSPWREPWKTIRVGEPRRGGRGASTAVLRDRRAALSYAPCRGWQVSDLVPSAHALGYFLAPLRGWARPAGVGRWPEIPRTLGHSRLRRRTSVFSTSKSRTRRTLPTTSAPAHCVKPDKESRRVVGFRALCIAMLLWCQAAVLTGQSPAIDVYRPRSNQPGRSRRSSPAQGRPAGRGLGRDG